MKKLIIFIMLMATILMGCVAPQSPSTQAPSPPPPVPVVLIVGGQLGSWGIIVPKDFVNPFSNGVPILERTIILTPYEEPGCWDWYEFSQSGVGKMLDIIIESDHPLADRDGIRGSVYWDSTPGPSSDRYPIYYDYRIFYVNKETRIEGPWGSRSIYSTAIRLVFDGSCYEHLVLENYSDDSAIITCKVYDAGFMSGYREYHNWLGEVSDENHQQVIDYWNIESIDSGTLIS